GGADVLPRGPRNILSLGFVGTSRLRARKRAPDEELVRLLDRQARHTPTWESRWETQSSRAAIAPKTIRAKTTQPIAVRRPNRRGCTVGTKKGSSSLSGVIRRPRRARNAGTAPPRGGRSPGRTRTPVRI